MDDLKGLAAYEYYSSEGVKNDQNESEHADTGEREDLQSPVYGSGACRRMGDRGSTPDL